jgi:predicted dehydrogenase
VKVAVLGLGSAGSRHARNLLELGHEVTGFDPVSEPPAGAARSPSVEAAIEAADAVVVASPSSLHAAQALAALERRRHVLVEKPLATTVPDAERVVAAADSAGVVAAVAMNLRFHPGVVELKRLIDEGALGRIMLAQASFGYDLRLWRPQDDYRLSYSARADLGGGVVFDAIHELDYLLWLLGPVASVTAETDHISGLEVDVEDIALAILRFDSGVLATVDLNFFEPVYRRGCLLVGSRAVARWDWSRGSVTVSREGEAELVTVVRCDISATYRSVVADFVAAVEHSTDPKTTDVQGLEDVRLATAVKRAAAARGAIAVRE